VATVELARFPRQTKVGKEEESCGNRRVSANIDENPARRDELEDPEGNIFRTIEVVMGVVPRDPGMKPILGQIGNESVKAEGKSEDNLRSSEGHEAEVAADVQTGVGRLKDRIELLALLHERPYRQTCVDDGDQAQHDWPDQYESDGDRRDVDCRPASDIFYDVVPMTLNDDMKHHDDDGNTDGKRDLNPHVASTLLAGDVHLPNGGDVVEPPIDNKGRHGLPNTHANHKFRRQVAPEPPRIIHVTVPNDGI